VPITSASTYDEVKAEYRDTADYRSSSTAALARRHAAAIRHLMVMHPLSAQSDTQSVSMPSLEKQLEAADAYADAVGSTRIVRADFSQVRAHG
jgi:hypothetical protein